MGQRTGPKGPVYGCTRYPECKGTRSMYKCPKCGGDMTRREGPNGPFYGCLRYPACNGNRSLGEQPQQRQSVKLVQEKPETRSRPSGFLAWISSLFGR